MLYSTGKGRYQEEYKKLWSELVPASGQAETVQGELVRVTGRLASEYYRNGNGNWNMGFRMFTNFLNKHLRDGRVFSAAQMDEIEADIEDIRAWGSGTKCLEYVKDEDAFDRITDRVVEWCQHQASPIAHKANPKLRQ